MYSVYHSPSFPIFCHPLVVLHHVVFLWINMLLPILHRIPLESISCAICMLLSSDILLWAGSIYLRCQLLCFLGYSWDSTAEVHPIWTLAFPFDRFPSTYIGQRTYLHTSLVSCAKHRPKIMSWSLLMHGRHPTGIQPNLDRVITSMRLAEKRKRYVPETFDSKQTAQINGALFLPGQA